MRIKYLLFIFILSFENISAQIPGWIWADRISGSDYTYSVSVSSMATDPSGNVYLLGIYNGGYAISFGSSVFNGDGTYLVKYDGSGNFQWAVNGDGSAIAADANGNVYVAGSSYDTITGYSDANVVKYDGGGNQLWSESFGGDNNDDGIGVSVDASNNIYFTGTFNSDSIYFDSVVLINNTRSLFNPNNSAVTFIAKLNSSGKVNWAEIAGTSSGNISDVLPVAISSDANGNTSIAGTFASDTLIFGTNKLANTNQVSFGTTMFIVQYDANGNLLFSNAVNGNPYTVSADASGNIYATGYFTADTLYFNATSLVNTSTGSPSSFIAKYNAAGNVSWAQGGNGFIVYSSALDPSGNLYSVGTFSADTLALGNDTLTQIKWVGNEDVLIMKHDPNGNLLWARSTGGILVDQALTVASDASGNITIAGVYNSDTISFGSDKLSLSAINATDVFVAKMSSSTGVEEVDNASGNIGIYPNPAFNNFSIELPNDIIEGVIEIYDMVGRRILNESLNTGEQIKPITITATPGIYLVEVITADKKYVQKLVIQ